MASGTVPVVADATALPEIVGSGGVVFRNGRRDDLREKLKSIVQDESRLASLSATSRTRGSSPSGKTMRGRGVRPVRRCSMRSRNSRAAAGKGTKLYSKRARARGQEVYTEPGALSWTIANGSHSGPYTEQGR